MNMGYEYFLNLKPQERADIFQKTSTLLNILAPYIEKDFWVCFVLYLMFNRLPENHPTLLGMLIRDTSPDLADLNSGGKRLANLLQSPTECQLVALYLPCAVSEFSEQVYEDLQ